jgi:hypothetical protein
MVGTRRRNWRRRESQASVIDRLGLAGGVCANAFRADLAPLRPAFSARGSRRCRCSGDGDENGIFSREGTQSITMPMIGILPSSAREMGWLPSQPNLRLHSAGHLLSGSFPVALPQSPVSLSALGDGPSLDPRVSPITVPPSKENIYIYIYIGIYI